MKNSIRTTTLSIFTAFVIAACGGTTDTAGIGGSGVISSGTITGFGSIFVNGVEFETSSSTFDIDDDNSLTESDLAVGMRVVVTGSINSDGVTGNATSVTYDDQLQGPVTSLTTSADGTRKTFITLGTTVHINETSTNFDAPGTAFNFGTIAENNHVEISGYLDSNQQLIATRVELKEDVFDFTTNTVELIGNITGLSGTSFSINSVNINAISAAIEDLPNGLAENAFVEVEGTCTNASCTTINASRVEGEGDQFDDANEVEIEGIITRYVSDSDFDIDGFPFRIDASSAQKEPAALNLAEDMLVEVEGNVINNVLVASEVELEEGESKVVATVAAVNVAAGTFELKPVATEPSITVQVNTSTEIEDEVSGMNSSALLGDLSSGDFIRVEGYDDGTGKLVAKSMKREKAADDVIVEGIVTAASGSNAAGGSVTVLGVTIPFTANTDPNPTGFDDENENPIDADTFIASVTPIDNATFIKVKDRQSGGNLPGTADEIDLEAP